VRNDPLAQARGQVGPRSPPLDAVDRAIIEVLNARFGRRQPMMSDKIQPHHLERRAILYVRQSSRYQVLHNRESRALQYAMRDRLVAFGWSEIEIIDDIWAARLPAASCAHRHHCPSTPASSTGGIRW
jgi:hypothetical protein